jgi:hypothetical protein
VLESIGHNSGLEGRLIYGWWNFEVLAISSLRAVASREAAAADLVIIAVHDLRMLSQKVADWVQSWVVSRKDRTGAMAVMARSDGKDPDNAKALAQLKELAEMGRMDFLFQTSHGDAMRGRCPSEGSRPATSIGEPLATPCELPGGANET